MMLYGFYSDLENNPLYRVYDEDGNRALVYAKEDAAMYAAAEDLLKALKNAEQYQIFAVQNSTGPMQLAAQYDLDKTRSAIAKATAE